MQYTLCKDHRVLMQYGFMVKLCGFDLKQLQLTLNHHRKITLALRYSQGWKRVTPVDPFYPLAHRTIQMWLTYDPLVTHMLKLTWKNFDMEECHRFLHSWQDTEPVPCTNLLKMKSLDISFFKPAWDNKLVSHQWYFSDTRQMFQHCGASLPFIN